MELWEYCQVSFFADISVLNDYGKKGWEAFSTFKDGDNTTVFMKRRRGARKPRPRMEPND